MRARFEEEETRHKAQGKDTGKTGARNEARGQKLDNHRNEDLKELTAIWQLSS
jgi:hypothetical protein